MIGKVLSGHLFILFSLFERDFILNWLILIHYPLWVICLLKLVLTLKSVDFLKLTQFSLKIMRFLRSKLSLFVRSDSATRKLQLDRFWHPQLVCVLRFIILFKYTVIDLLLLLAFSAVYCVNHILACAFSQILSWCARVLPMCFLERWLQVDIVELFL